MASSKANPPAPNLASLLLVKQKMAAKNGDQINLKPPPPAATGAYSNEKISYHQNVPVLNSQETTTTTLPTNTTEQPKISRKTKQLEVSLLDKKMEEINRKQATKTNETLDTWKGFDSLNYGFNHEPGIQKSTPVPPSEQRTSIPSPLPKQQPSPSKTPEKTVTESPRKESPVKQQPAQKHISPTPRTSSPKRVDSPVKDQPRPKSPAKEKETPPQTKVIQKQPTPPPSPKREKVNKQPTPPPSPKQEKADKKPSPSPPPPPPRRSKNNSTSSSEKPKSPEQEQPKSRLSKSPTPITESIIPVSLITSNPQKSEKNVQPFEQSPSQTSTGPHPKLFPDIKHYEMRKPKNAHKSIQRSMDRYRFHVW